MHTSICSTFTIPHAQLLAHPPYALHTILDTLLTFCCICRFVPPFIYCWRCALQRQVWDVTKQAAEHTLTHHSSKVQAVCWNPVEAPVLLTGGFDAHAALVGGVLVVCGSTCHVLTSSTTDTLYAPVCKLSRKQPFYLCLGIKESLLPCVNNFHNAPAPKPHIPCTYNLLLACCLQFVRSLPCAHVLL